MRSGNERAGWDVQVDIRVNQIMEGFDVGRKTLTQKCFIFHYVSYTILSEQEGNSQML